MVLASIFIAVTALAQAQPNLPAAIDWPTSSAAQRAHDEEVFSGLGEALARDYGDLQSVVVVRGGRVVFEYYKSGSGPDDLRDIQSVTKSVLSSLVGLALTQGRIASLDQPIVEVLPELAAVNADPRANGITWRHLLTMTAGFDERIRAPRDQADNALFAFSRPLKAAPGEAFAYDNLSSNLLAIALEKAVGQPVADYALQHLGAPLAITQARWQRGANGHHFGSAGLHLRTRDMAKLGQLVLDQGRWGDRQIVARDYVRAATDRQSAGASPVGLPYGYMWWIVPSTAPRQTFFASGHGGQLVWVYPPFDMVVATTAEISEASSSRGQELKFVRGPLFDAVRKKDQAPAGTLSRNPVTE